jgi:hydroxyacylglutathione hydrolase
MDGTITRLHLFTTNAYLVRHNGNAFLIDSGLPKDWRHLLALIRAQGIEPGELRAVIHTHGHSDHVGNSERLRREFHLPLVLHRGDLARVQSGDNGPLRSASWMSVFARPFVVEHFPAFTPDILLDDNTDLATLQFPGQAIHTPGHTDGSICVLVGQQAIVGDLIRGSLRPWNSHGATHFFHDDRALALQSLSRLVQQHPLTVLHPGHFQPITRPSELPPFSSQKTSS